MPSSHEDQIEERKKYTDLIINSTARYKIVVAGAGTGKSFTFKSLLTARGGGSLALTFINNLARDLVIDLSELADVYTFHGYCKSILHTISAEGITSRFHYYPKLPKIVSLDAAILGNGLSDFDKAMQTLTEGDEIEFYIRRANYYNSVGYNDSVYRVLSFFRTNPTLIPTFTQIVVDEYQDFNPLEVEFIEQLAQNNHILIAGDDDQALYRFKHASAEFIRNKAKSEDYEKFELPFCSRCTQVVVSTVVGVISKARSLGLLENRVEKNYICFMPEKELDSQTYPKIIHAACSIQNKAAAKNYIGKFIENEIGKIPQGEIDTARGKNYPCILILGQSQYLKQIYHYLKDKFTNIEFKEHKEEEIEILEGYRILMRDEESNLGWRIIIEFESSEDKSSLVINTEGMDTNLIELLESDFKEKHLAFARILKKIIDDEEISEEETALLKESLNLTKEEAKSALLRSDEEQDDQSEDHTPTIKLMTISSSKGMSAGFTFIVGMNNGNFPRNQATPTDDEVCQFIVALTRTRKQCYLISNRSFGIQRNMRPSNFINWINQEDIQEITVDASYFRSLTARS